MAKTLFHVDGIERDSYHAEQIKNLKTTGDSFPLQGSSGIIWGKALRSTQGSCNPIYVSVGHKIGLDTAVSLTHACCRYRIPEPIRQTDRYNIHSQLEHLQSKYVGTGHADTTKFEWLVNQHRDSGASYIGHYNLLDYFALVENESRARTKFNLLEKMLQPCGNPPHRPEQD